MTAPRLRGRWSRGGGVQQPLQEVSTLVQSWASSLSKKRLVNPQFEALVPRDESCPAVRLYNQDAQDLLQYSHHRASIHHQGLSAPVLGAAPRGAGSMFRAPCWSPDQEKICLSPMFMEEL